MFKNIQSKSELIKKYSQGARDFPNSFLTAVKLKSLNLAKANFNFSNLIEINWSNSNLDRASFEKTYLCLSNFENCSLIRANLQGANLERANLKGANLQGANLERANLKRANLQGVNLRGANFKNVQLDNTCLAGAIYDGETLFDDNLDPDALKMIVDETTIGGNQSSLSSSKQARSSLNKILSWCRCPKLNWQPQD